MALIKCPECGKEISDKAASCPNCGYESFKKKKKITKKSAVIIGVIVAVIVFVIAMLLLFQLVFKNNKLNKNSEDNQLIGVETVDDFLENFSDCAASYMLTNKALKYIKENARKEYFAASLTNIVSELKKQGIDTQQVEYITNAKNINSITSISQNKEVKESYAKFIQSLCNYNTYVLSYSVVPYNEYVNESNKKKENVITNKENFYSYFTKKAQDKLDNIWILYENES